MEEWSGQGVELRHLRHTAEQRPGFVFQLLGQRNVLAEIADFRKQRPGFPPIEAHFFDWKEYGEQVRTHSPHLRPDLLQVPSTWCNSLAGEFKILAPVAERIDQSLRDKYEPAFIEPCLVYGDPPLYGLPWLVDVRLLYFWRGDLPMLENEFRKSNNARETFWHSLRIARHDSSVSLFAIPTASEWELMHHLALLVWGQGGQLVESRTGFRHASSPAFQEPALRGATYLRNLLQEGLISLPEITRQDLEQRFLQHRVSSMVSGPWLMQQIQKRYEKQKWDELVGVSLPPLYESPETAVTFLGGTLLGITGRLPAMKAPALLLAQYLSEAPATLRWTEAEGLIPAAKVLRGRAEDVITPRSVASERGACRTYYDCLAAKSLALEPIRVIDKAIKVGRGYPAIPQWWDLEVPGSLGPIHHFWLHLSTLQLEDALKADLTGLAADWDAILRAKQKPSLAPWVIISGVILMLAIGGLLFLWFRHKTGNLPTGPREGAMSDREATPPEKIPERSPGAVLGAEVKETRMKVGHSIEDVAARTEIDPTTIGDIENGKRKRPHPKTVRKLRAYINDPGRSQT